MARLIKLATLNTLVLVLAVAITVQASIYRTTTVTTTYENEFLDANDWQSRKCQHEMMKYKLDACCDFLKIGSMRMVTDEKPPEQCCLQLKQASRDCRCELIKQMMRKIEQEGGYGISEEMMERAKSLPGMCGVKPQRCMVRQDVY